MDPGELLGPTDVQAVCEGDQVVALHRPESVACEGFDLSLMPCSDGGEHCTSDADCEAEHGAGTCASFDGLGGACACVIPCTTDADCPADRACLCRTGVMFDDGPASLVQVPGCYPADCRTDSDCGPDAHCGMVNPRSTCLQPAQIRLTCRTVGGCQSDADCPSDSDRVCAPPPSGGTDWECRGPDTCQ